jgi:hypothetical protein
MFDLRFLVYDLLTNHSYQTMTFSIVFLISIIKNRF